MLMVDDEHGERTVTAANYYNFDFTGVGFTVNVQEKFAVVRDVNRTAGAHKAMKTTQFSTMAVNMKMASAMNAEGKGMEQVLVFKHESAALPVTIRLSKEAHDGKDVIVMFTADSLTGPQVLEQIMTNQLLPFIASERRNAFDGVTEPVILTMDGDPDNVSVLEKLESKMNDEQIRIGIFSASQSHVEQVTFVWFCFFVKEKKMKKKQKKKKLFYSIRSFRTKMRPCLSSSSNCT